MHNPMKPAQSVWLTVRQLHKMPFMVLLLLFLGNIVLLSAQTVLADNEANRDTPDSTDTTVAIYLPIVARGGTVANPTITATPSVTPGITLTPSVTPSITPSPTATATATTQQRTLPTPLVATWFNGNAPLNDFYNPQTGEWRDVNGLGQMYVFGTDGSYTYTGFLRIQTGSCRSEVSTFKQGSASASGSNLTFTPVTVKTRTVVICGSTSETITDGPYDQVVLPWSYVDQDDGHEVLTVGSGDDAATYNKLGMVPSLAGVWQSDALSPDGFYDPSTDQFTLDSPEGMWFDFGTDLTYRFGEHNHGQPDENGCYYEWWTYQTGAIEVVGGRLTVAPTDGSRRYINSCTADEPVQESWLDDTRVYTWFYRDRATVIKLVIIPLSPFVEFIFQRP